MGLAVQAQRLSEGVLTARAQLLLSSTAAVVSSKTMMVLVMCHFDLLIHMGSARETARERATTVAIAVAIAVKDWRGDATQFFHGDRHGSLAMPT